MALEKIQQTLMENNILHSKEDVRKKISIIKGQYRREITYRDKICQSDPALLASYRPRLWFYDLLSFMHDDNYDESILIEPSSISEVGEMVT